MYYSEQMTNQTVRRKREQDWADEVVHSQVHIQTACLACSSQPVRHTWQPTDAKTTTNRFT